MRYLLYVTISINHYSRFVNPIREKLVIIPGRPERAPLGTPFGLLEEDGSRGLTTNPPPGTAAPSS